MGTGAFDRGKAAAREKIADTNKRFEICRKAIEEKLKVIESILDPHFAPHAHKFQIANTGSSILIKATEDKYPEESFSVYPNIEWDSGSAECRYVNGHGYNVVSCVGREPNCDEDQLLELAGEYFVRKGG